MIVIAEMDASPVFSFDFLSYVNRWQLINFNIMTVILSLHFRCIRTPYEPDKVEIYSPSKHTTTLAFIVK